MARSIERAERLVRLLDIFEQQERAGIAEIDREIATSEVAKSELMSALNAESALHGIFVDVIAQRMRRLNKLVASLQTDRDGAMERLLQISARCHKAEDLLRTGEVDGERLAEKKALEELLEWSLSTPQGRGKSSPSR